ncbi:unnamed protein product [Prorocentrum cordatum]|uniref:Uncharacterized protein n=1 Tax=Prorocentrum cordatum TaxID=2364126 RepID=A0ABN9S8P4_9DINO|nr:unnamed protein product [Polarella glacialis]
MPDLRRARGRRPGLAAGGRTPGLRRRPASAGGGRPGGEGEEQVRFLLELPATHGGRPLSHQGIAWLLGIPEEEVAAFAARRCGVRATFQQQMRVWVRRPREATVTLELREGSRGVPLGRSKLNVAQLLDREDQEGAKTHEHTMNRRSPRKDAKLREVGGRTKAQNM